MDSLRLILFKLSFNLSIWIIFHTLLLHSILNSSVHSIFFNVHMPVPIAVDMFYRSRFSGDAAKLSRSINCRQVNFFKYIYMYKQISMT